MANLYSPSGIRELLNQFGMAPLKSLGQNFLIDQNIAEKIAAHALLPGENVIEVGPGPGALTRELAKRAKKVVAVEIDRGMVELAKETLAEEKNVVLLHEDFLKADLEGIAREHFSGEHFAIAGNLPYYITAKCIEKALKCRGVLRFTAMVQKEVAERLSAPPGGKDYGSLTAFAAYFGGVQKFFGVSGNCFFPQPEVDSAVVQIVPGKCPKAPLADYEKVVRALFAMRRKTVYNNLKAGLSLSGEAAETALRYAGVEKNARAEQLSKEKFALLAQALYKTE